MVSQPCVLQKNELTISEAKSLVQSAGEENGVGEPPETAVLQASVKRLTSEVDELKAALSQKDEELHQSQAQFNDTNTQLQQLVRLFVVFLRDLTRCENRHRDSAVSKSIVSVPALDVFIGILLDSIVMSKA